MNGTIYFRTLEELAEFLKAYTGGMATWSCAWNERESRWILEFNGGY